LATIISLSEKMSKDAEVNIKILIIISFIEGIYVNMVDVIFQPYILSIGFSMSMLGLFNGILFSGILGTVFMQIGGILADIKGRRKTLILSKLFEVLGYLILFLTLYFKNIFILIIGAILVTLSSLASPAWDAIILESSSKIKRGFTYSQTLFTYMLPGVIFTIVGGYTADIYGYEIVFMLSTIFSAIILLLEYLCLKETLKVGEESSFIKLFKEKMKLLMKIDKDILNFYCITFLDAFAWSITTRILFGIFSKSYRFTNIELGLLAAGNSLTWTLIQIPLGKIIDKIGVKKSLIISETVGSINMFLISFIKDFKLILIIYSLCAIEPCIWIPSTRKYLADKTRVEKRGGELGKFMFLSGIASLPGSFLGGLMYDHISHNSPLILTGLLLIFVVSSIYTMLK